MRLHARDHGPVEATRVALLCLPGLTRNAKDFESIAGRLAEDRRVICPDFRGRGRSQYASDPTTYRPDVEVADTLRLLDTLGIERAAIIGTSRGGIVAMVMATRAKDRMAGVLFNDIGPRIDKAGLLRIRTYLGNDPQFGSWDDAVAALKATNPGFETLTPAEWLVFARRVFRDADGVPRADYDAGLTATFPSAADIEDGKTPELWGLFDLLAGLPVAVLRGEHSDLLSAATVAEMVRQLPQTRATTVRNRGHVPFLDEPESLIAIDHWLADVDSRAT
ncbi:MAG: alpha/beta hydrolase [Alphaproteobacteria bacterium]|nr:alpha/beta hydrolase [Alphaproteobacteria bacterium]